jgi:hypothetical protein
LVYAKLNFGGITGDAGVTAVLMQDMGPFLFDFLLV